MVISLFVFIFIIFFFHYFFSHIFWPLWPTVPHSRRSHFPRQLPNGRVQSVLCTAKIPLPITQKIAENSQKPNRIRVESWESKTNFPAKCATCQLSGKTKQEVVKKKIAKIENCCSNCRPMTSWPGTRKK